MGILRGFTEPSPHCLKGASGGKFRTGESMEGIQI